MEGPLRERDDVAGEAVAADMGRLPHLPARSSCAKRVVERTSIPGAAAVSLAVGADDDDRMRHGVEPRVAAGERAGQVDVAKLVLVLSVFVVVQLIEGYLLTPRIMGERTGLHPIAIIVAVFFWGQALGGIMGMIFAIPLTAFLASVLRLVKEKYVTELV